MKLNYKDDMTQILYHETWPRGYTTFLCLTQLSMKVIMLIDVKMLTIVGILTFISTINVTSESLKARKVLFFFSILIFISN